jgi:hypothetical protein
MKTCLLQLQSLLDSNGVALGDRAEVAYTAAARAIAYKLPLPSSPLENPYGYFLEKHKEETLALLSEINESCVIRVEQAAELVKRIWVFRYQVVYDACSLSVMATMDVIAGEGDRYVSPAYKRLLKEYSQVLISSGRIFADALADPAQQNVAEAA